MPLKSFQCPTCKQPFERILSREQFDALHVSTCPECGTESPETEWEVPSRRNPQHGIVR